MKKITHLLLLLLFMRLATNAQETLNVDTGVERWSVKTSLEPNAPARTSKIDVLLSLPNPITSVNEAPQSARITKAVNGMKEGDMVTISAWLLLVALEDNPKDQNRDGDFHIQVRNSPVWGDSCLIVEIPYPDFIGDPQLKAECTKARQFVLSNLLNSKEPGTRGNIMQHPVFVTITGQLFFDATHLHTPPRGKLGMHSYTCWELHPVTSIAFAPKPAVK